MDGIMMKLKLWQDYEDIIEKLKEVTDCSVCKKSYTDPKILPCLHTFCLGCLEEVIQAAGVSNMRCPECKFEFTVPVGGCKNLRSNPLATRLSEFKMMLPTRSGSNGRCSACSNNEDMKDAEIPAATSLCVDCGETLCDSCAKIHKQFKLTKSHKIMSLNEIVGGNIDGVRFPDQPVYCRVHPTILMNFFCSECLMSVCTECLLVDHKSHQYTRVEEASKESRLHLDAELTAVENHIGKFVAVVHEVEDEKLQLGKKLADVEKEIVAAADEIKNLVDRSKAGMVEEIEKIKKKKVPTATLR